MERGIVRASLRAAPHQLSTEGPVTRNTRTPFPRLAGRLTAESLQRGGTAPASSGINVGTVSFGATRPRADAGARRPDRYTRTFSLTGDCRKVLAVHRRRVARLTEIRARRDAAGQKVRRHPDGNNSPLPPLSDVHRRPRRTHTANAHRHVLPLLSLRPHMARRPATGAIPVPEGRTQIHRSVARRSGSARPSNR
jgi:hypothetical protein